MTQTALSPEERADLKAKAEKATPGPWNDSGHSVDDFDADCCMRMEWVPNGAAEDDDELNANSKADGAFIAAANPSVILSLLASLEAKDSAIRAELSWLEKVKNTSGCRYTRIGAEGRINALQSALFPSKSEADRNA